MIMYSHKLKFGHNMILLKISDGNYTWTRYFSKTENKFICKSLRPIDRKFTDIVFLYNSELEYYINNDVCVINNITEFTITLELTQKSLLEIL